MVWQVSFIPPQKKKKKSVIKFDFESGGFLRSQNNKKLIFAAQNLSKDEILMENFKENIDRSKSFVAIAFFYFFK